MGWNRLYHASLLGAGAPEVGDARSRAALLRNVSRELEAADRHGCNCLLLRLQLTGLDLLLPAHDQAFVESVLRVVAERLRRLVRMDDLVTRTGIDEFTLIAQGIDGPPRAAGEAIAQRLLESVVRPYGVDGVRFELGLRIGIACYPHDAKDAPALLLAACQALHAARRMDGDGWRFAVAWVQVAREG